jgi:hypothetical protein
MIKSCLAAVTHPEYRRFSDKNPTDWFPTSCDKLCKVQSPDNRSRF